jgi:RNA polymerase sigma factor (sigma-70 family)
MEASALHAPAALPRLTHAAPLLRLRSDDQLVALFRAGHDEAFRAIHDRYRTRLLVYTTRMLGTSRSDGEDALQDVFVRAYDALSADERPVNLRPWLYRVAHNRCIDQIRRAGGAPANADLFDLTRVPLPDPPAVAERRDDLRRLVSDLHRLPHQQRSALLMRELEGLSHAELSRALGVSVPAVKSLLVRARVALAEAGEARDTACGEIREAISSAHGRGVRSSSLARRHLHECASCRAFRKDLRRMDHRLAAFVPAPLAAPITALANLLGLGGAGSAATGAASGTGTVSAAVVTSGASTAGSLATGSVVTATATKLAAAVATAAAVGGGAAEVSHHVNTATRPAAITRVVTPVPTPNTAHVAARGALVVSSVADAGGGPGPGAFTGSLVATQSDITAGAEPVTGGQAATDGASGADSTSTGTFTPIVATPEEAMTGGTSAPDEPETTPQQDGATPVSGARDDATGWGVASPATSSPSSSQETTSGSSQSTAADAQASPSASQGIPPPVGSPAPATPIH